MVFNPDLLPALGARRWVGPQTKSRIPPQSGLDSQRLTISFCGLAHRGHVCGFLVFWLQVAIEPFTLFHHSGFDYSVSL